MLEAKAIGYNAVVSQASGASEPLIVEVQASVGDDVFSAYAKLTDKLPTGLNGYVIESIGALLAHEMGLYIHDTVRKECVNVAILFHSPDAKMVRFGTRGELRTLKSVFPDLAVPDLRSYLQAIQKTFDQYHQRYSGELSIHPDINKFCLQILPEDDSSMQWIGTGSGITDDLDATFERLLLKLVSQKTSSASEANRSDYAVWSIFSKELKKRNMLDLFKPIELNISGFTEEIKHTYQNGALHCLKPISLDLSNSENMLDKVYKTRGWHETIQQSNPDRALRFYYLIGKPLRPDLIDSYHNACELLRGDDSAIVITEDRADELPGYLESAVSSHH